MVSVPLVVLSLALAVLVLPGQGLEVDEKFSPWDLLLTPGTNHPSPREGHTATLFGSNVYVFGGYYPSRAFWGRARQPQQMFNQPYRLNLQNFTWAHVGGEATRSAVHRTPFVPVATPAIVTEDEVYSQRHVSLPFKKPFAKDTPSSPPLSPRSVAPSPRADHVAGNVNGVLYIFGGLVWPGTVATNELWRFVPAQNEWSLVNDGTTGPLPRAGATSWTNGTRLYVYGGFNPSTNVVFSDTWYFEATSRTWNFVNQPQGDPDEPELPGPRAYANAIRTPEGVVVYSGQTNAPYKPSHLDTGFVSFNGAWEVFEGKENKNPRFPLPVTGAAAEYYAEGAFVVIGGLPGAWGAHIDRCGWYNPNENNFVGYDPDGLVRVLPLKSRDWDRGTDAPFWETRNITGRLAYTPTVHFGNNIIFFGGVGCEDPNGINTKPLPAFYGQFNQLPIYNLLADRRTQFNSGGKAAGSAVVVVCGLLVAFFSSVF